MLKLDIFSKQECPFSVYYASFRFHFLNATENKIVSSYYIYNIIANQILNSEGDLP